MASASVVYPDEVLLTTSGKSYFTRLTRLLICGGTKVLRELFDSKNPSTHAFLTANKGRLQQMRKTRVLTSPQWKSLFPTNTTCGKSTDFDITLIFKLLREFCSLTAPAKGWDELPDDTDLTLPADLARIKYYRNDVYAHVNDKMELSDTDFQDLRTRIKDALLRIVKHYDPSAVLRWEEAIEKLLTNPLSEEAQEYEEVLEKWYLQDQDVKKMISNTTEDIRKDIRDLKAQLNPSSPEKNDFTRLTRLLISGGTVILRGLFDKTIPPQNLVSPQVRGKLQKMKDKNIITSEQWKSLFPTNTTCGKSTDFEITLIFKLLKEFCTLTPPAKGWDELPDDRDLTLPADLARIKYYRNSVYAAHVNDKMELSDTDFQDLWTRIKDALLRIVKHYDPSAVLGWKGEIEKLLADPLESKKSQEDKKKLNTWCNDDPGLQRTPADKDENNAKSKDEENQVESAIVNVQCTWRSRMEGWIAGSVSTLLFIHYKDDPASLINLISDALPVGVVVKAIVAGSVVLQLSSTSVEALNELLSRHQSGRLKENLQRRLMTEEIKTIIGGKDVEFSIGLREEEIENARHSLIGAVHRDRSWWSWWWRQWKDF